MAVSIKSGFRLGPDSKLLDWLDNIEQEGIYWRGQAHRDDDRYERIYQGLRRAADTATPRFRANVVGPTIRRRNALLTENKPVFKIEPAADGYENAAAALNELADFVWQDHGFQGEIESMVEIAAVFRAAGMSLRYDARANGGLGSIVPKARDSRAVLIDPGVSDALSVQTAAKYVVIESVECVWDIQRDFPGRGMEVKPEGGVSGVIKSPLNRGATSHAGAPISYRDYIQRLQEGPIPRVRRRDYFIRDPRLNVDGSLLYPRGRHVVRAGDVILSDGPAPFYDGEPDLVWFENRRDFSSVWGHNEIEALRYVQSAINRIGEKFVSNTVLMGNSRVVADSDALGNDTLNRLTNADALVITKRRMSTVDWQPPPPMPPHFLEFISFALRLVDYLVGLSDGGMEGRGRIEMRSGVQLEGLQNASQVLIRAHARVLEKFIERLGRKFISRVFQFYTTDRLLYQMGPNGETIKYLFSVDQLRGDVQKAAQARIHGNPDLSYDREMQHEIEDAAAKFRFMVQPLSSLAQTKVARAQLLMQLVEAVMLPRNMILREIGFHDADTLVGDAMKEAAAMQAQNIQPQTGKKSSGGKKKAA